MECDAIMINTLTDPSELFEHNKNEKIEKKSTRQSEITKIISLNFFYKIHMKRLFLYLQIKALYQTRLKVIFDTGTLWTKMQKHNVEMIKEM